MVCLSLNLTLYLTLLFNHMAKPYTSVKIDPNFNRITKPNKSGKYGIHILIHKGSRKVVIPTGIKNIALDEFQDQPGKWIKKPVPNSTWMNATIGKIKAQIDDYIFKNNYEGITQDLKSIKEWYVKNHSEAGEKTEKKEEKFLQFFERFKTQERKGPSYLTTFNKLSKFPENPFFEEMNRDYFKKIAEFFKSDPEHKVSETSADLYFTKVKTAYKEWCREKDTPCNTALFEKISFSKKRVRVQHYLTPDQMKNLSDLNFEQNNQDQKREVIRDIFLFLCYTSRYYTEIRNLTFEKNVFFEDENPDLMVLRNFRSKTDVLFECPIYLPEARDIFEKYNAKKEGRIFPQLDYSPSGESQEINRQLEIIGKKAGIPFKLTVKVARNTFRSNIAKDLGPDLRMQILGHDDKDSQNHYLVKTDNIFQEALRQHQKSLGKIS